ncbi:MAG: ATP-binding protein, partial [Anaerolineaceae bacterium]|nr:ATP-binding protein [Anaerolineaceae bacterium]
MRELALHLLDIAENSISAGATNIQIIVKESTTEDRVRMSVQDDGCGMDAEMVTRIVDPFVTSRTTRKVGLGIPLLKAAAEACNGYLTIHSAPSKGTRLEVEFQRSHIDRMPLGDLPGTILSLVIGSPHHHWTLTYSTDEGTFEFDDAPIKQE